MAGSVSPGDYKDAVLFLATAGIAVPLFKRLKVSPVLGFLLAGTLLGPFGLGQFAATYPWLLPVTVSRPEEIAQVAEFGLVFLLFSVGLELSFERLRLMRRLVFGLGAAQLGLAGLAISLVAWGLGLPPAASITLGAALALSSTAMTLPTLAQNRQLHSKAGRVTFAVLLFQDMAIAPILIVLSVLGHAKGQFSNSALLALVPAIAGLAATAILGRLLLRPMFQSVARAKSQELFMAAVLLVVVGAGLASAAAGLSMALGAFVAGLMLAETEYRHEVEVVIAPFKDLLLGLLFLSIGIGLDLKVLAADPVLVIGSALGILALKFAIFWPLARVAGLDMAASLRSALLLASCGEFSFVVLRDALAVGALDPRIAQVLMVAATLSMCALPMLDHVLARRTRNDPNADPSLTPEPDSQMAPNVIIVGFGRVGNLVGEMLTVHNMPWLAIDRDPKSVRQARKAGLAAWYGDAGRAELLQKCGIDRAQAVVITMDSPEAAEAVVALVRSLRADMPIIARARDARHAMRLYELGATNAIPETIEASLQLSEAALVDLGIPMGRVIASIHERRDRFRKALARA